MVKGHLGYLEDIWDIWRVEGHLGYLEDEETFVGSPYTLWRRWKPLKFRPSLGQSLISTPPGCPQPRGTLGGDPELAPAAG